MGVERLRNSKVSNILFEKNLFIYKQFVKKILTMILSYLYDFLKHKT